jgi:hypothetical protein
MLSVTNWPIMRSVIRLNVVMLSVLAPYKNLKKIQKKTFFAWTRAVFQSNLHDSTIITIFASCHQLCAQILCSEN